MKNRGSRIGYAIICLWMISPMIPVAIAGSIASRFECRLDEGSVHSCIVFGNDIGQLLYTMGVLGWFFLVTIPSGLIALVVWSVIVWRRSRDRSAHAS